MQFQVIMVTDPPTNTQTHRQDQLQYTVPELIVQCKYHCSTTSKKQDKHSK